MTKSCFGHRVRFSLVLVILHQVFNVLFPSFGVLLLGFNVLSVLGFIFGWRYVYFSILIFRFYCRIDSNWFLYLLQFTHARNSYYLGAIICRIDSNWFLHQQKKVLLMVDFWWVVDMFKHKAQIFNSDFSELMERNLDFSKHKVSY